MNAKLFAALTIFPFLFSITSYSPENSAFAESEYKTQENPQTTVISLTGRWRGKVNWTSKWTDIETVKCEFRAKFTLNLQQNGNVATGNARFSDVKVISGKKRCKQDAYQPYGGVSFTVFGSGFTGTVNGGLLPVNDGQIISNEIRGSFEGTVPGGYDVKGSFKADRVSKR